jgi:hypothetical protein
MSKGAPSYTVLKGYVQIWGEGELMSGRRADDGKTGRIEEVSRRTQLNGSELPRVRTIPSPISDERKVVYGYGCSREIVHG